MAPALENRSFVTLAPMTALPSDIATSAYPSFVQGTYEQLRTHLVTGAMKPGEKLKINTLSDKYGVSPGAVREALSRLSAEGLVVAEPQRGFRVSSISLEELRDLTAVRIDLEVRCLRRSMLDGDVDWETRVVGALHRLLRTPRGRRDGVATLPDQPWEVAHAAFHDALVSACGSTWLLSLRRQLYAQSERYRLLAASRIGSSRDLDAEHRALVEVVLDRNVERAVALITAHFSATVDNLLRNGADLITT